MMERGGERSSIRLDDIITGTETGKEGKKGKEGIEEKEGTKVEGIEGIEGGEEGEGGEVEDILPIQGIQRRKRAVADWKKASVGDREYVLSRSPYVLHTMGFEYVTHHWYKVLLCYVAVCAMCLCVGLLRDLANLSGYKKHSSSSSSPSPSSSASSLSSLSSSWYLLQPWTHTHLAVVSPALNSTVKALLPPAYSSLVTEDRPVVLYLLSAVAAIALPMMIFDFIFRPLQFLLKYSHLVYWVVSYGLALALRGLLLLALFALEYLSPSVVSAVRVMLRYTIWCQFIRRKYRFAFKSVKSYFTNKGVPSLFFQLNFLGGMVSVGVVAWGVVLGGRRAWGRVFGVGSFLTLGTLVVSMAVLSLSAVCVPLLAANIALPGDRGAPGGGRGGSRRYDHQSQLNLLLLLVPLLVYPTVEFSRCLLFAPQGEYQAALPLFDLFGPERLNFLLALLAVVTHLIASRQTG